MRQPMLPIWGRAIFVDWHGVLSRDPFWLSIVGNGNHPLRSPLQAKLAEIFSRDLGIANEWMRGARSSEEIISAMTIGLDRRFRQDFLSRRLDIDCRRMRVNVELFEVLRALRARTPALVVIATDNMDCFVRAFEYVQSRARRQATTPETLADWAVFCDDIVCSSEIGRLKSEDPTAFFGPWLSTHDLSFSDALLIDDRADNCAAFVRQGGTAVQWKMGSGDIREIAESLDHWMKTPITS